MLIISVGMPKSGSAYYYKLINEIMITSGNADANEIKSKYKLDNVMQWDTNYVEHLSLLKLFRLYRLSLKVPSFVIKTHERPRITIKLLNKMGKIKILYIYRDPRDTMLSAIDHGKIIIARGENHSFAKMVEFGDAIKAVKKWLKIWKMYTKIPNVLTVKYEDLVNNPVEILKTTEDFLNLTIDPKKREEIIWKYSKENPKGKRRGLHYNKAVVQRYKNEMTHWQKNKCEDELGHIIRQMGYKL